MTTVLSPLPDRIQLPWVFRADLLQREVDELLQSDWIDHFVSENYEGHWDIIPLRGPAGATHPILMATSHPGQTDFEDTPFVAHRPHLQSAMSRFQCPLLSVRLMRLGAGSVIKEHRDYDLSPDQGQVRLHVPIVTHPEVYFWLNGERVLMEAGSCWYLRLSDPHAVENRGSMDRIHLVLDMQVNDWLAEQLASAAKA